MKNSVKQNIGIIVIFILLPIVLAFNFYQAKVCWNIPIAERTGICALKN